MATRDFDLESMVLCSFCGSRRAKHTDAQRRYCDDALNASEPHRYTVDVILHAHVPHPCLICGKGRNDPLHEEALA